MASIIYDPTAPRRADDPASLQPEHAMLEQELRDEGSFRAGGGLYPAERYSRRIRLGNVTDGPYSETKELIGGFYLYECAGWDEAVEIAKRIPVDSRSFVEVRPVGIWNAIESHEVNLPGSWV